MTLLDWEKEGRAVSSILEQEGQGTQDRNCLVDIPNATERRQLQTHSHLWYSAEQQSTQDLECLLAVIILL